MTRVLLAYSALILLLSSCYSNKSLVYLKDRNLKEGQPTLIENHSSQYRLQVSDILSIQIKSATESSISNVFNMNVTQAPVYATPGSLFLEGYSVSSVGSITMPMIGEISVEGLTLPEVQKLITENASKYLRNPVVTIKLTNFKVTVLGEVRNPGYYYVYNERISLLEALGLAGDLTSFGNRKNVKLIRQTHGNSQIVLLDLTNPDLLRSEYFFLMPGDALYVEPLRARVKRTNLEVLSVVFAGLTTTVLILTYINLQN